MPAPAAKAQRVRAMKQVTDHHSYARPAEAGITHLNWNASVDFDSRTITGVATYDIETAEDAQRIVFDTHDLTIHGVSVDGQSVEFNLGDAQPFIGSALTIPVTPGAKQVAIDYTSSPGANALLWVEAQGDRAPSCSPRARPSWPARGCPSRIRPACASPTTPPCRFRKA